MKLGIMQPYLFPYIGYFQLMDAVDEFVVYDNIEYTKKGWINRNRILVSGKDAYFTVPLRKDSDYLHIRDRHLAENWELERKKVLNRIIEAYRRAPYFKAAYPMIEDCLSYDDTNLFNFILNSLLKVKEYLDINTRIIISSAIEIDHGLKAENKVIEICKARKAETYINPIGGLALYDKDHFKKNDINLFFIKAKEIEYKQLNDEFIPWLSIIDLMMFLPRERAKEMVSFYNLI